MALRDNLGDRDPLPVRLAPVHPVHDGKRFLVTGAARGLGRAVAGLLTEQGAAVWGVDILADPLAATAAELGLAGHAVLDVGDPAAIATAVDEAYAGLGSFDGVVNIAGIARPGEPLEIEWAQWQQIFGVNLFGSYEIARLVARRMIADGTPGAIVNTASEAGKVGHVDALAYSASKAAVISMTRMLSEALAPYDINVNCVCPGSMPTDMLRDVARNYAAVLGADGVEQDVDALFARLIVPQLHRHTAVAEVAQVYSFLLSDAARLIRGQAVNADGGQTPY